jgi:hypothetical protein
MYCDIEPLAILLLWIACVSVAADQRYCLQTWVVAEVVVAEIAAEIAAEVAVEVAAEIAGGLEYHSQI